MHCLRSGKYLYIEAPERELYDPVSIRRQLEELELALEAGAIDEDDFERAESALLERLSGSPDGDGEVADG